MKKPSPRHEIYSGTEWKPYRFPLPLGAAEVDLVTDRPAYDPASGQNVQLLPRQVVILVSGTLTTEDTNGFTTPPFPTSAGMSLDIQPRKLINAGSSGWVLVIW